MSLRDRLAALDTENPRRLMTVGELMDMLASVPRDTPVMECRYSDCRPMRLRDWEKRRVLLQRGSDWHRLLGEGESEKGLTNVVDALYFQGN